MKLSLLNPTHWNNDTDRKIACDLFPEHTVTFKGQAAHIDLASSQNFSRTTIDACCHAQHWDSVWLSDENQNLCLSDFYLLAMDMDSTLITIECIDEIADYAGLKAEVAAITEASMRGEISDFNESLRRRVALLKGLDAQVLQSVYDERLKLSMGAETLLHSFQTSGIKTMLVSGGFNFFTDRLQTQLNLDYVFGNTLEIKEGKLTGHVIDPIINAEGKAQKLISVCHTLGISTQQAIVIGDGSNDLKMMALAGLSIAFRAKPLVQQQASVALNYSGLDAIVDLLS